MSNNYPKFPSVLIGAGISLFSSSQDARSYDLLEESLFYPSHLSFSDDIHDMGREDENLINGSCGNGGCSANGSC